MKENFNNRGFKYIEFEDIYFSKCSIQKSSLAEEQAIWLGINDSEPKIMASQAESFGIKTEKETGWIDYPLPKEVLLNTRMHLTQEQVKELIPILKKFVKTGEI